ncbi:UNVERIFIED_CONTAM: hypothetical protein PYX00_011628 [Menopon gallinae]|uniref:Uncharacterized protein n=1 Tax=Menopon gallinae TaxID=328185 RepID=A0AAW2H8C4_9NEOP
MHMSSRQMHLSSMYLDPVTTHKKDVLSAVHAAHTVCHTICLHTAVQLSPVPVVIANRAHACSVKNRRQAYAMHPGLLACGSFTIHENIVWSELQTRPSGSTEQARSTVPRLPYSADRCREQRHSSYYMCLAPAHRICEAQRECETQNAWLNCHKFPASEQALQNIKVSHESSIDARSWLAAAAQAHAEAAGLCALLRYSSAKAPNISNPCPRTQATKFWK